MNKVRLKTRDFHTIGFMMKTENYILQGYRDFKVSDIKPESDDGRVVHDITNEMENYEERDTCGIYYNCYAVIEDDDIEFIAVEIPTEEIYGTGEVDGN